MESLPNNESRPLIGALDCVRPLLFENENEAFPFSIGGTCFLVEYHQRPFVITAAHVLENLGREPQEVAVQYDSRNSATIPLCSAYFPEEPNNPTAERTDLAILQVDTRHMDVPLWLRGYPLQIGVDSPDVQSRPADSYMMAGYPSVGVEVNYDQLAKKIHTTRARMRLEATEPPPWKECLSFTAPEHPELPEFDGISGAPILKVVHLNENFSRASLGGMVIRGEKDRRLFYAISGKFICEKLHQICTNHDIPHR